MIDRLAALPPLSSVPRDQLQWLLDHGEIHRAGDGAVFRGVPGEDLIGLFLLISGVFRVRVEQGGTEREVRSVTPGRVTGYLPYTRMTNPRGYLVADGSVEFLYIRREDLPDMARACYDFTALCVHEMLDRVRDFKSDDKRQEKMAALGRLSAGLAHELNNPASAAARAAREVDACRAELVAAARELGGLGAESPGALASLEAAVRARADAPVSPLEQADREDRIAEWLEARELDPELAAPLADCGLGVADLEGAASADDRSRLAPTLRTLADDQTLGRLTSDIESAVERIHALVAAIKKHTHMDRATAAEPVRLEEHLADTITLMRSKAALKRASLELVVEPGLPAVEASVSELNQVWLHLVDNAVDAVAESGRIVVDARRDGSRVVVRIVDDGPGIPEELQERVFEPFFTTKDVGEGRGLGLDIARTVVGTHRGSLGLTSVPGRTELRVTLPAAP